MSAAAGQPTDAERAFLLEDWVGEAEDADVTYAQRLTKLALTFEQPTNDAPQLILTKAENNVFGQGVPPYPRKPPKGPLQHTIVDRLKHAEKQLSLTTQNPPPILTRVRTAFIALGIKNAADGLLAQLDAIENHIGATPGPAAPSRVVPRPSAAVIAGRAGVPAAARQDDIDEAKHEGRPQANDGGDAGDVIPSDTEEDEPEDKKEVEEDHDLADELRAHLAAGNGFDIVVQCAMVNEANWARNVFLGTKNAAFCKLPLKGVGRYYGLRLLLTRGKKTRIIYVAIVYQHDMGTIDTTQLGAKVHQELKPRLQFMSGILGGLRGETKMGDVVVVDVAVRRVGKQTPNGWEASLHPRYPDKELLNYARDVAASKEWQRHANEVYKKGKRWLPESAEHYIRRHLPNARRLLATKKPAVQKALQKLKLVEMVDGVARRTAQGDAELLKGAGSDDGKPNREPEAVLAPNVSGDDVRADLIDEAKLAQLRKDVGQRKLGGVEMEIDSFYAIEGARLLAVKGVSDHADTWKDDGFQPIAGENAAAFILEVIIQVMTDMDIGVVQA